MFRQQEYVAQTAEQLVQRGGFGQLVICLPDIVYVTSIQ